MGKIIKCNNCEHAECNVTSYGGDSSHNYCNWYCKHGGNKKLIELSVLDTKVIPVPSSCPLIKSGEAKQPLSYAKKRELLECIEPTIKWEDIKLNTVYHVPSILNSKRMDIYITSKSDTCCYYKDISENKKNNYSGTEYHVMYKTTLFSRFLVEHKIKKIVAYNSVNK